LHSTQVAVVPCAVAGVGTPDSAWREVRATGFTFCVPASWKPSGRAKDSVDANHWKGDGTSVTWGLGRPLSGIGRNSSAEVTGAIVSGGRGYAPMASAPAQVITHRCDPATNTPLTVGGTVVMVTQVRCEGVTWTTTGWSTAPPIYVQGEAHTARLADLLVRVMGTIRFPSSP